MCRWLAYSGPAVRLSKVVIEPSHSLIIQSRFARENYVEGVPNFGDGAFPTNADGFGVGWFADLPEPGLYRDLRPAWSDRNLTELCSQVSSHLFFAHIRAAYDGIVSRSNAHPFKHGNWLFQHNGEISGYMRVHRSLRMRVAPELYPCIAGTTDTETCFYLALTEGLMDTPKDALLRLTAIVEREREEAGIEGPFRLTCAATDGHTLYAVRYATHGPQKTLYVSDAPEAMDQVAGARGEIPREAVIVLSEPLDDCKDNWRQVRENSFVTVRDGRATFEDFSP